MKHDIPDTRNDNHGRGPNPADPSAGDFVVAIAWALYLWAVVAGVFQVGLDFGWW